MTDRSDHDSIEAAIYRDKIREIQEVVGNYYHVKLDAIGSHSRKREIVQARQAVQYFARKHCRTLSLAMIARLTSNGRPFDHATVCNSIRKINSFLSLKRRDGSFVYQSFKDEFQRLESLVIISLNKTRMEASMDDFSWHIGNAYN